MYRCTALHLRVRLEFTPLSAGTPKGCRGGYRTVLERVRARERVSPSGTESIVGTRIRGALNVSLLETGAFQRRFSSGCRARAGNKIARDFLARSGCGYPLDGGKSIDVDGSVRDIMHVSASAHHAERLRWRSRKSLLSRETTRRAARIVQAISYIYTLKTQADCRGKNFLVEMYKRNICHSLTSQ